MPTYPVDLITRAKKGSPLNVAEFDSNLNKTEEALNDLNDRLSSAVIEGGGGTSDHGALTGLSDDDHPQYLNNTRGDARYSPLTHNHNSAYSPVSHTHANKQDTLVSGTNIKTINGTSLLGAGDIVISGEGGTGVSDHGALTGLSDDDHPQYLNDARGDSRYSAKTHNHDSAYSPVSHSHDSVYSQLSHTHTDKQNTLVSGTNIKTVNGTSLLGSGNLVISGVSDHGVLTGLTDDDHPQYHTDERGDARYSQLSHTHADKQNTLVSGTNIKTINGASLLGSGDITVSDHGALTGLSDDDHPQYHNDTRGDARYLKLAGGTLTGALTLSGAPTAVLHASTKKYVDDGLGTKQATLVSGTNIKTINGTDILGSGNLVISGVSDHGALTGLGDDDHPQYLNNTRGDARYSPVAHNHDSAYSAVTHTHTKTDVGLSNVDDTADSAKNVLSATKLTTGRTINGVTFDGTGNVTTTLWGTARTLSFTGDVTGSASVNGSANVATAMTLANSGVTAGTYTSVTVDAKGRVTEGTNPTTLADYGITDAYTKTAVDTSLAGKSNTTHSHSEATTGASGFMSATDKTKLNGIEANAQVNMVTSVAGRIGVVTLAKADVGLGNVDNTSDINKPISAATQAALDEKSDTTHNHDHGALTGLSDDDHPQYLNNTRGDARYSQLTHTHTKTDVGLGNVDNTSDANKPISTATQTALNSKQGTLVSGTNIKTINGASLLGSGDIIIATDHGSLTGLSDDDHPQYLNDARGDARYSQLAHNHDSAYSPVTHNHDSAYSAASHTHTDKQDVLVSGTNIKTINGASLLGTGDIVIEGSGGSAVSVSSGINYVINGNFDIWQRGTVQTATGYGSDDRWMNQTSGTTKTHSRVACTDTDRAFFNASFFSRTAVTSVAGSTNYCIKAQKIEDVTKLAGKTVTLSFWAKSDAPKNMAVEYRQYFGTGGTPSAQVEMIGVQKIALTDQWQKFELTAEIPSVAGKTLGTDGVHTSFLWLIFWFDAGTAFDVKTDSLGQQSGTFDIAQVQLEEGSSATDFKHRHMAEEMALCQRYYETTKGTIGGYWSGSPTSGNAYFVHYLFRVAKRVAPTIVLTNVSALRFPTTAGTVSSLSAYSFLESRSANATNTSGSFASAYTADAEL